MGLQGCFDAVDAHSQQHISHCGTITSCVLLCYGVLCVTLCCAVQVKWKDLVSDLNLVPTTMDVERTGAMDLGIGNLPLPFANFKKSECTVSWHIRGFQHLHHDAALDRAVCMVDWWHSRLLAMQMMQKQQVEG
jgi:hypothetical protein